MRQVVTRRNCDRVLFRAGIFGEPGIRYDTYRERLIKYIPIEIIVIYIALYGSTYAIFGTDPVFTIPARWLIIAGIICTPIYLWKCGQVTDWVQLLISTIGFGIWVFALGVIPVSDLPGYNQIAAAIFLPVYTFVSPLIDGVPERF